MTTYRGIMILMNGNNWSNVTGLYYVWDQITGIWFNRDVHLHVWSASTLRAWLPPVKEQKIHKSIKYITSYKLKENIKSQSTNNKSHSNLTKLSSKHTSLNYPFEGIVVARKCFPYSTKECQITRQIIYQK